MNIQQSPIGFTDMVFEQLNYSQHIQIFSWTFNQWASLKKEDKHRVAMWYPKGLILR